MPSLLVSGAVHQALVSEKLRTKAGFEHASSFTVAPASELLQGRSGA